MTNFKKGRVAKAAMAGIVAATLCVGIAIVAQPQASAANVTINKLSTETDSSSISYNAYKIFSVESVADDGSVSGITWANSDVQSAVEGIIKAEDNTYTGTTAQAAAEWIAKHVTGTDATTRVAANSIANKIADAVDGTTVTTNFASGVATDFAKGYWLIVADSNSVKGKTDLSGTSPVFTVVGDTAVTITPKTSVPTLTKTIKSDADGSWGTYADSQIGQLVDYKLVGTVADNVSSYSTYSYSFEDQLSNGLTLVNNDTNATEGTGSVAVTIDGTDVTAQASISCTDNKLVVSFADLKNVTPAGATKALDITADTQVIVTYKAKLNSNAVIGSTGNDNTAKVVYSNNPNTTSTGSTKPSTVRDYTYQLKLVKIDMGTNETLSGVKFTIQATGADDAASKDLYVQSDGSLASTQYEFTTNDSGEINVAGLDAGTYTVKETQEPTTADDETSYKKLSSTFTFTIEPTIADGAVSNLSTTVSGNANAIAGLDSGADNKMEATDGTAVDVANGKVIVSVGNEKGIKLPLTGEQAMALGIAAGIIILSASVIVLVRRRRNQAC